MKTFMIVTLSRWILTFNMQLVRRRATVITYHVLCYPWHSAIEDPVLADIALSWLPEYFQRAGGRISDSKVSHSSKGHYENQD